MEATKMSRREQAISAAQVIEGIKRPSTWCKKIEAREAVSDGRAVGNKSLPKFGLCKFFWKWTFGWVRSKSWKATTQALPRKSWRWPTYPSKVEASINDLIFFFWPKDEKGYPHICIWALAIGKLLAEKALNQSLLFWKNILKSFKF